MSLRTPLVRVNGRMMNKKCLGTSHSSTQASARQTGASLGSWVAIPERLQTFPDRSKYFPVLQIYFPVSFLREFARNPLQLSQYSAQFWRNPARIAVFPCKFPVIRGIRDRLVRSGLAAQPVSFRSAEQAVRYPKGPGNAPVYAPRLWVPFRSSGLG